jgi:hypothetical protein
MSSSATPSLPTRSTRLDRWALLLVCSLWGQQVSAHDESSAVPDTPGWRLGVSVALADLSANRALPSQKMSGYLLRGDAGVDRRDAALEHAVLDAAWRMHPQWSAYAALGQHDKDRPHTEAAWLRYQWTTQGAGAWALQAGRSRPELGPVMTSAGHMDEFTLLPLAKRLATDGGWIDDGAQLSAQHAWSAGVAYLNVGVWQGDAFPGSQRSSSPASSMHLGLSRGDWRVDGFVAHLRPDGRGSLVQSSNGVHTHNTPDCSGLQAGVQCFRGRSRLSGASLQWASHDWPITAQGAYWERLDDGTLQSVNGLAEHTGRNQGTWLQAMWQVQARWKLGFRSERIWARLSLEGAGANLLAQEAGLTSNAPMRRHTAVLSWQVHPQAMLSAETGRELQAGQSQDFAAIRLVLQGSMALPGP